MRGICVWVGVMVSITCGIIVEEFPSAVRCPYPYQQVYSEEAGKCLSLVNGPCEPGRNNLDDKNATISQTKDGSRNTSKNLTTISWSSGCIAGAICSKRGRFGYCICAHGLLSTADRKCAFDYGEVCSSSEQIKCDTHKLLGCVDGKCQCENVLSEYDYYSGTCLGKVGSFCTPVYRHTIGLFDYGQHHPHNHDTTLQENVFCGHGAFCYAPIGERFENGVCRCDGYYTIETENRTCEYRQPEKEIINSTSTGSSIGQQITKFCTAPCLVSGFIVMLFSVLCLQLIE